MSKAKMWWWFFCCILTLGIAVVLFMCTGCVSQQTLDLRIGEIEARHGVTVTVANDLSRCYAFGDVMGLLDVLDESLESGLDVGPIFIEESFVDNCFREGGGWTCPLAASMVLGYVWPFPPFEVHLLNRSLAEKADTLFIYPDRDVVRHELCHSGVRTATGFTANHITSEMSEDMAEWCVEGIFE